MNKKYFCWGQEAGTNAIQIASLELCVSVCVKCVMCGGYQEMICTRLINTWISCILQTARCRTQHGEVTSHKPPLARGHGGHVTRHNTCGSDTVKNKQKSKMDSMDTFYRVFLDLDCLKTSEDFNVVNN